MKTSMKHSQSMKSTAPPSSADKFSNYFDKNWIQTRSTIRNKLDRERSYDPTYSWEARSDNPQSFSRLQATDMPVQNSRPITLSGCSIIPLDKESGLDTLNAYQPPRTISTVPLTQEQKDIGMNEDYSGKVNIYDEAKSNNKIVILEHPAEYRNMHVQCPQFRTVDVPKALVEAGDQCDKKLLNPAQRREILEYEKNKKAADVFMREVTASREKLRHQITGQQFHRGIVGVDSSGNVQSQLYGNRARKEMEDHEYRAHLELERRSYLAKKTSSLTTNGNILVPESLGPRVKVEKFYQSKGGDVHGFTFNETYNRIFLRNLEKVEPDRTQNLRQHDLNGKEYNIISHVAIEHYPVPSSTKVYRPEEKHMLHASQASLELPRNLQGSLRIC